ncbi:MAG: uncharacterized protein JWO36_4757 [Myxococcales bacterium]|nr:uncharacterized protein [Myxococcales bacterium]
MARNFAHVASRLREAIGHSHDAEEPGAEGPVGGRCDGSHHTGDFAATDEPLTKSADMLEARDGALEKLCRCGGSNSNPFCDGTHKRIRFRSDQWWLMDTSRIENARHHLIALHKAIIDAERLNLERLEGRLTGGEMLQRLVTDARFNWLHALTELIVRLDEMLESDTGEDVDACLALALRLLTPEGDADPFRKEYARLLQESPDVVLAHASATRSLSGGKAASRMPD